MQILLSFIPLLAMVALCAAYAKLAALIFRKSLLSWRSAFLFALLLGALAIAGRAISVAFDYSLPIVLSLLVGFVINLLLGSWFFSNRAKDPQGQFLGWRAGMVLSTIMFGLLGVSFIAFMGVIRVLSPMVQS